MPIACFIPFYFPLLLFASHSIYILGLRVESELPQLISHASYVCRQLPRPKFRQAGSTQENRDTREPTVFIKERGGVPGFGRWRIHGCMEHTNRIDRTSTLDISNIC